MAKYYGITCVVLVISLLFISGCEQLDLSKISEEDVNKVIVCEAPYIRHATGCCLDQNENKVCDNDEGMGGTVSIQPTTPSTTEESTQPIETPLETTPTMPQPTSNLDLANFPEPFVNDGVYNENTVIVVGARAPASDTMGAVDIATLLQYESKVCVGDTCTVVDVTPETMLSSELADNYQDHDLIIISSISPLADSCPDPLLEKFVFNCGEDWGLSSGEALIQFMDNGDHTALIVAGTDAIDTRMAVELLKNYKDYGELKGNRIKVFGTLNVPRIAITDSSLCITDLDFQIKNVSCSADGGYKIVKVSNIGLIDIESLEFKIHSEDGTVIKDTTYHGRLNKDQTYNFLVDSISGTTTKVEAIATLEGGYVCEDGMASFYIDCNA